nr:hypothetical protein [Tanacetum cinerariifolium]
GLYAPPPPSPAASASPRPSYASSPSGMVVTPRSPQQRRLFQLLSPPWRVVGAESATTASGETIKSPNTASSYLFFRT